MRKLILSLTAATVVFGQEPKLLNWMNGIAQQQLARRGEEIAKIRTEAQAEERKQRVRAKILELLGGLPDYDGPLKAQVAGRIDRGGYVIEKVRFESLPGIPITANLYRPARQGRFAGVLLPLGHWEQGKPAVQTIAANLALKGFVVLAYDPLGQGERLQAYDARLRRSVVGGSVDQHLQAGAQSLLVGQSFARYRIWDAKRALDYLVSRPEVDAERIGCTGCSGGGTLTTYISALDPRIKVAAPACYLNSFRTLFPGSVGDSEQSLPNFLAAGLDQTDYVELFAPKPWLISSTEGDFFTLPGARQVFEEARDWYKIYGAEDRIKWVVGPGGHGTPLMVREAIYDWMIHWLNFGNGSSKEERIQPLPDHELRVTGSGQIEGRDIYEYIRETPRGKGTPEEMLAALRDWVRHQPGLPEVRVVDESKIEGIVVQRVALTSEPGVEIEGSLLLPGGVGSRPALVYVNTSLEAPAAVQAAKAGNVVLVLRPRGYPSAREVRPFAGDWITNMRAMMIGRNLPGMRALDVLRGVDLLAARNDVDAARMGVYGADVAGVWALMAASLDQRIAKVWLDRTPYSLRAALDAPVHRNLHDAVLPGFALRWDLSDMVSAIAPRELVWTDPVDWMRAVAPLKGKYHYTSSDASFKDEVVPGWR